MKELISDVVKWADSKGILEKATLSSQFSKMKEEVAEVEECIDILDSGLPVDDKTLEHWDNELVLEIGDVMVTAIILAELSGNSAEDCLTRAYEKISQRTGKMINGTFVKDRY